MSLTSSPVARHDVERLARVQHGGDGGQAVRPVGVVAARDRLGGRGEREQRVAPAVGRGARVRGAALGAHASASRPPCGARRRRPRRRACARRPRSRGRRRSRRSAPRGRTAPSATPRRRPAAARPRRSPPSARRARASRRARARRRPSCRPCPSRPACRRRARAGGARRATTTVSRWPSSRIRRVPAPAIRATMSCAWPGEEHGMRSNGDGVGQQRGADGGALLRAPLVARGRGDADERLELALGAPPDLMRAPRDPVVHDRPRYPATVYGRCPSCLRWRSSPAVWARRSRARRSSPPSRPASTRSRPSTRR